LAKISVIVPVYNAEKYLVQCLNSIINQTFKDIEIICINDGSTDNSLKILKEFSEKDSRIKIINQKNSGVSIARNKGIDTASGDYIFFVDSDDWCELKLFETIYKKAVETNADVVVIAKNIFRNEVIISDTTEKIKYFINDKKANYFGEVVSVVTDKLIKKDFLKRHNIRFVPGIKFGEDTLFSIGLVNKNAQIEAIPEILYNYRFLNKDGLTCRNNNCGYIKMAEYILSPKIYANIQDCYKETIIKKVIGGVMFWFGMYNNLEENNSKINIKNLINYKKFLLKNFDEKFLLQLRPYLDLQDLINKYKPQNSLFSIQNQRKHKIIKIGCIKISFKIHK
jgi:glycosyltransferase involved in cell wall biosynthesis